VATSASQTYIARLGFQDRDRCNERHGLACEYLFERMLELEVAPHVHQKYKKNLEIDISHMEAHIAGKYISYHSGRDKTKVAAELLEAKAKLSALSFEESLTSLRGDFMAGKCVNVPIMSRSYVNGFADVLINTRCDYPVGFLGEVKITKEPAENVLQQINFYLTYLGNVETVYIVTDYDPGDLKRLCAGTKIKVYRLGQVFEQWLANRTTPATEEL
jgi:hypothetical protein